MENNTFTAIDPGKSKIGAANFRDGQLESAFLLKIEDGPSDPGERWAHVAHTLYTYDNIIYEMMQVDGRTEGAKISAIMDLCGVIGAICGRTVKQSGHSEIAGYTPSTWNKNRGKGGNQAKILRALKPEEADRLLDATIKSDRDPSCSLFDRSRPKITTYDQLYERAFAEAVGQAEHTIDAVGIGLYHLGRLR